MTNKDRVRREGDRLVTLVNNCVHTGRTTSKLFIAVSQRNIVSPNDPFQIPSLEIELQPMREEIDALIATSGNSDFRKSQTHSSDLS